MGRERQQGTQGRGTDRRAPRETLKRCGGNNKSLDQGKTSSTVGMLGRWRGSTKSKEEQAHLR